MRGRFTILGTSSAIPTKERNHPAVYFQFGSDGFLFDCGEGTQRQLQLAGISFFGIDKIFITHLHGDHVLGLPGLLQTLDFHDKGYVEIYGPKGVKDLVELSTTRCFYINTEDMEVKTFEVEASPEGTFTILETDTYRVLGAKMLHSVECFGYAFEERERFKFDKNLVRELGLKANHFKELKERGYTTVGGRVFKKEELGTYQRGFKFVYITDTYYTENIFPLAENADYLILECTFFNEEDLARETKHLSFTIFARDIYPRLKELNVKNIYLTHFSRRYKDLTPFEEGIKRYKMENVFLARDFLTVEF